jgi:glucan 1,3-beta-glucosidase
VVWLAVTANAIAGGTLIGWSIANVPVESLGLGGWLRSLAFVAVAALVPPSLSAAAMRGTPLPRFSHLLGPAAERIRDPLARLTGAFMIATTLLAILTALGLVFDPRYRDFPFAPLTAAVVPFFMHSVTTPRPRGRYGAAELAAAAILALSVPYIALNESFANWQSLWLCGALAALAFSLGRVRDPQS